MRSFVPPAITAALAVIVAGCGANPRAQAPATTPPPPVAAAALELVAPPSPPDPVSTLIATSERHFANGQRELKLGHLEQARSEFDRALTVLLESPSGARSDARMRDHFDRIVDRISAFEMTALTQGDGFTEKKYEAASIDELLEIATFERPAPAAELKEAVKADLESTRHDIPIPLNSRVLSYVELFQGKLRDYIGEGLQRGSRYLPMIQSVFRAEGLPLDLAYVPLIESAFKPSALSRAKAQGVWQFMRGTALEYGLRHDWYIDERSDPEKATRAAAKYLKKLHSAFKGDWHLALASYNGGPTRVQRALKKGGVSDFWELTDGSRVLPRETREYVPMILAAIIIARNPVQYGFNLQPAEPVRYDKVTVEKPVDLRRVAEWTGASIDEIQGLNPELRRWTTPVRFTSYDLKVPAGTGEALRARLADVSVTELSALKWYTVKRGESLATIARKLRVNRGDLAGANNLSVKSRVVPGKSLIIPRAPATVLASRMDRPVPAAETLTASRSLSGAADTPEGRATGRTKLVYRVKRGDTLSAIARIFETTVDALKSWNRLRGTQITPGDRLTVYRTRQVHQGRG